MYERNIDQLTLSRPQQGTWPATRARALTWNQTSELTVRRMIPNPLNHTSQGSFKLLNDFFFSCSFKELILVNPYGGVN